MILWSHTFRFIRFAVLLWITSMQICLIKADTPVGFSHNDTTTCQIDHRKLLGVSAGHTLIYGGTLATLNHIWFREFARSSFHFHNDAAHWLQMDKLGHATTAYHLSALSRPLYAKTGLSEAQSTWAAVISTQAFMTGIEILDGFAAQWGASPTDIAANLSGSALFLLQQNYWGQQKIILKFSYAHSGLAHYRPSLLGENLPQRWLKDYNAQTYWLSLNLTGLLPQQNILPAWLNLAVGHGAYGMLGASHNPSMINGQDLPLLSRHRNWYLAPDIDLSQIKTGSVFWDHLFQKLNFIKFPTPGIKYNSREGISLHWLVF